MTKNFRMNKKKGGKTRGCKTESIIKNRRMIKMEVLKKESQKFH